MSNSLEGRMESKSHYIKSSLRMEPKVRLFKPERVPRTSHAVRFPIVQPGQRIEIEIGCGVGFHPISFAQQNPKTCFIALEHTKVRFEKFQRRLQNHRSLHPEALKNLLTLQANAVSWITHEVPDASIDRYWILYPNPYPKKEHLNRRWHAMPFASKIISTLKSGGELVLATNETFYAEEAVSFWAGFWKLGLTSKTIVTPELLKTGYKPMTHFEKKYLQADQTCYQLTFQKGE